MLKDLETISCGGEMKKMGLYYPGKKCKGHKMFTHNWSAVFWKHKYANFCLWFYTIQGNIQGSTPQHNGLSGKGSEITVSCSIQTGQKKYTLN